MEIFDEELQRRIEFAREKQRKLHEELMGDDMTVEEYESHCYKERQKFAEASLSMQDQYIEPEEEVRCPRCHSKQVTANQKGFGFGKAVAGGLMLGPVGLLGGFIGSKKIVITCLKCGFQWKP